MTRRMDWDLARRRGRPGLSKTKEAEWSNKDRAAKWLSKAEPDREKKAKKAKKQ